MAERRSEAEFAPRETQTAGRPTGPERFAAALAASRGTAARPQAAGAPRRVRKARLRLSHVDPWSVLKTALLLSIALGVVTIVAVGIVWASSVQPASGTPSTRPSAPWSATAARSASRT